MTASHPALARAMRSPMRWLGTMAGLKRTLTVDGVLYRPRRPDPARPRARHARGSFEVVFPTGQRMRIRPTAARIYPDLIGQRAPALLPVLERIIRPGWRVALLASGTGQTAWWLGLLAGPSGSVVALERDGESVRYARRRYATAGRAPTNIAFEIGSIESLAGELDASFDAVIAAGPAHELIGPGWPRHDDHDAAARLAGELGRILAPGGWIIAPAALAGLIAPADRARAMTKEPLGDHLVLMHRPLKVDTPTTPPGGASDPHD